MQNENLEKSEQVNMRDEINEKGYEIKKKLAHNQHSKQLTLYAIMMGTNDL